MRCAEEGNSSVLLPLIIRVRRNAAHAFAAFACFCSNSFQGTFLGVKKIMSASCGANLALVEEFMDVVDEGPGRGQMERIDLVFAEQL